MRLESSTYPRVILHVVVRPCDLVEPALTSTEGTPGDRAVMAIAFTLMHLYTNPDDRTEERIATIAPLFDAVLEQEEARAAEDMHVLWSYLIEVFEPDSAVRELLVGAVSPRAREAYLAVLDELCNAPEDDA
jgi:hypothetical protein